MIVFQLKFLSHLDPTWAHLGTQNHPKMEPSWHQNLSKLGHGFEGCFLKDVGSIFLDFLSQHNIAYIAKTLKKLQVFEGFWYIGIIWLLCGWDDFLMIF